jgi:hypothetical protein
MQTDVLGKERRIEALLLVFHLVADKSLIGRAQTGRRQKWGVMEGNDGNLIDA